MGRRVALFGRSLFCKLVCFVLYMGILIGFGFGGMGFGFYFLVVYSLMGSYFCKEVGL